MSYQVLARKWRPQDFSTVVGQEAVLQALSHSLDNQRLHHAYLFSGTRGVGKTSIARIFAKALNCEKGISSTPCNQCHHCSEINAGNFMDLFEVDGASRTKVEDTRELMENVQYPPLRGRYKVYIIDEVHMLSTHSFNALLKTLEEPPKHAIFLLATTDPQRLPVTVLSRCLQFHLKALPPTKIAEHLKDILQKENIAFVENALIPLAKAADGSIRDALSLLDQAIAYGNGEVCLADVQQFLGVLGISLISELLTYIANNDATLLFSAIQKLSYDAVDFEQILEELISLLHELALYKQVPHYLSLQGEEDSSYLAPLAALLTPEDIQLYYQICLKGREDLPLAPTAKMGFEMVMLRLLTFVPLNVSMPVRGSITEQSLGPRIRGDDSTLSCHSRESGKPVESSLNPRIREDDSKTPENDNTLTAWEEVLPHLSLKGLTQLLATHCVLGEKTEDYAVLLLDPAQEVLLNSEQESRLSEALSLYYKRPTKVTIKVGKPDILTPAKKAQAKHEEKLAQAQEKIQQNPHVGQILKEFNAKILSDSINYK